jgi:hypothetical protein
MTPIRQRIYTHLGDLLSHLTFLLSLPKSISAFSLDGYFTPSVTRIQQRTIILAVRQLLPCFALLCFLTDDTTLASFLFSVFELL